MSEGRTSAAQADVEGEDRPADAPASTGTTGAGAVTGSGGTNGHGTEDTTSDTTSTEATTSDATTADATTSDATTADAATTDGKADATTADAATTDEKADETAAGTTSGADGPGDGDTVETVPAATLPGTPPAPTSSAATSSAPTSSAPTDGDDEWADAEDKAYKREMRKGFAFGAAGGIVIGAIVALLLGALVWPGYLLGPGDPQDTANQVTQALSAKDAGALDALSCKGPNGQPVTQLSPQVLQYITKVAPAGPTTTLIDTEARTPIDLTLSVQGQTQTLPSELVLGETKGDWCLKGLAQRQQ